MIALVLAAALNCGATATQADLDECASASNKAAMAREARAYKALVQRHPNDSVLSASEMQWQRERQATCDFYAAMVAGGSMTPMVVDNCWADSADDRVRVLALYTGVPNARATVPSAATAANYARFYGLLENRLTAQERAVLAKSENTWLQYRNDACARATPDCATTMTRARVETLKNSWLAEPFWK